MNKIAKKNNKFEFLFVHLDLHSTFTLVCGVRNNDFEDNGFRH